MNKSFKMASLLVFSSALLSGCYLDLGFIQFGEKPQEQKQEENKDESGEKGSGSGGGQQGGGSSEGLGTPLATVTLTGCTDAESTDASPIVFTKNSYTVTVEQGSASTDLSQAIANTKTYEFRVYKGMNIKFAGPQAFSKLLIKYSTYVSNGTSYYFDFDVAGATNENDESKGEALLKLDSAATSFAVDEVGHQTRIATVAFYA